MPRIIVTAITGEKTWVLYLLECKGGSFYAGITNDLEARYAAHLAGKGARYTRARPPIRVVGSAPFPDRSTASKAEWQIKQLPKAKKRSFLASLAAGRSAAPA